LVHRRCLQDLVASWMTRLPNRAAGGSQPPAPTPPGMRVRTGRFTEITGP
jgi:hypothetical protein